MPTLSQIKIGPIQYNLTDYEIKENIPTISNNFSQIQTQLDTINNKMNKINLDKGSGLIISRYAMPSTSSTSRAAATNHIVSTVTWSLPTRPAFGIVFTQASFTFGAASSPGSWIATNPSIRNRSSSTATSSEAIAIERHQETVSNGNTQHRLMGYPFAISHYSTGWQTYLLIYHSNANNKARNVSTGGYITILWSKANDDTKTFSFSNNTISYG